MKNRFENSGINYVHESVIDSTELWFKAKRNALILVFFCLHMFICMTVIASG